MSLRFSGARLKATRVRADLPIHAVAHELHRSPWTIDNWERGRSTPRSGELGTLAEVLGCAIDDLFEDVVPDEPQATRPDAHDPAGPRGPERPETAAGAR